MNNKKQIPITAYSDNFIISVLNRALGMSVNSHWHMREISEFDSMLIHHRNEYFSIDIIYTDRKTTPCYIVRIYIRKEIGNFNKGQLALNCACHKYDLFKKLNKFRAEITDSLFEEAMSNNKPTIT